MTVMQCDGSSLRGVGDESVDLVFSFDSLVHADAMTMDAYVGECARVLRNDGVAFLDHSNLAACVPDQEPTPRAPLRTSGPGISSHC